MFRSPAVTRTPDQSAVKLMYAPQGTTPTSAYLIPLVGDGFMIPPNSTDYTYSKDFPNPTRALAIKVYGLMPHMHTLGKRITIKGPSDACLVDIPKWDFHWQSQYFRPQPFTVPATGSVTLTCTWDTTPRMRSRSSFWKPFMTERTTISAATPSASPAMEISAMKDMKRLAPPSRGCARV